MAGGNTSMDETADNTSRCEGRCYGSLVVLLVKECARLAVTCPVTVDSFFQPPSFPWC